MSQEARYINIRLALTDLAPGCSEMVIKDAIYWLSSGRHGEMIQGQIKLRDKAQESRACKAKIVYYLLNDLDKPNLNFELDRASYFLWRGAVRLLGEWRAAEAIPVFIEHLALNDGTFSASMVHQPAIIGLISMGPIAMPQLRTALLNNGNADIRIGAAFCLTSLGGNAARRVLTEALRSESNECVRRFIVLSVVVLDGKRKPPLLQLKKRQEWMAAFRCH
jgi:HEAT repeat protein